MTFDDCKKLLKNRDKVRLSGRNTYLRKSDDHTFTISYHWTDVVKIHDDGTYTLNSGGWYTCTTKARMCAYTPANLAQIQFEWYIDGQPFKDGCRIDSNGHLIES